MLGKAKRPWRTLKDNAYAAQHVRSEFHVVVRD
jgi:hypothetical protein